MRWLNFIPGKSTLIVLFNLARRRVSEQTGDVAELTDARLVSATEELNKISDDIRDAHAAPEEFSQTLPAPDADDHSLPGKARHCRHS